MKRSVVITAALLLVATGGCNSTQKSVDPGGRGLLPRGPERSIDKDTIQQPGRDTTRRTPDDSLHHR